MTENDRAHLYTSLLRGIANECQDRLCATDTQHAWSDWHRTQLRHDGPLRFVEADAAGMVPDEIVRIKSERRCLNCGKEQVR